MPSRPAYVDGATPSSTSVSLTTSASRSEAAAMSVVHGSTSGGAITWNP